VKCARSTVADELVLDGAPDMGCGDAMLLGDVLKLASDHAEDLREDAYLHAVPGKIIDGRSVEEDVVGEFIVLQGEQNLIVSAGVACRRRVQNSREKRANVLYPASLSVEHGDDRGITRRGWGC
jgi:hypothetical protein